jgi:hypothetical protein
MAWWPGMNDGWMKERDGMNAQCFGVDCALIGWSICNNHDILGQWNERNNSNGTLFNGDGQVAVV